tara:strand:- start:2379 stop:2483 length:105 start_codon:yes stop_codon:yes gene_type:complete
MSAWSSYEKKDFKKTQHPSPYLGAANLQAKKNKK